MKRGIYIQSPDGLTKRWRVVGIALVIVCFGLTGLAWWALTHTNTTNAEARLATHADKTINVLAQTLESYSDILYASRGLALIEEDISAAEWEVFVKSQSPTERYPGLRDVIYVEQVSTDVAYSRYTINPAGTRLLDMNVFEWPTYKDVLNRSALTLSPAASRVIPAHSLLVGGREGDLLLALALYRSFPEPNTSDAALLGAPSGYAVVSVNVERLVTQTTKLVNTPKSVGVSLADREGELAKVGPTYTQHFMTRTATIDVGGTEWQVAVTAPSDYGLTPREHAAPYIFLTAGIVLSFLVLHLYFKKWGVKIGFTASKPHTVKGSKARSR